MDAEFTSLVRSPAFLALVDHLPCVLYITRTGWPPEPEFISSNVERFTGYRPEDFCARPQLIIECMHPDDRARVAREVRRLMDRPEPYRVEYSVIHAETRKVYHAAMLSVPVLDARGRVIRRQGLIVDVTEQKRLEAELLRLQRLAVIGEMARMMAHDIRNPLAGMGLALRALRGMLGANAEAIECLDDAVDCMERMARTVSQAEDFAAARPLVLDACALAQVVGAACRRTAAQLRRRNVRIEANVPDSLPALAADRAQLEDAFACLILHAARLMPEGGLVAIGARTEGPALVAEVAWTPARHALQDASRGTPPLPRPPEHGMSLGLALCQRILAAHGGALHADGAAFRIEIPLEPSRAPRSAD